MVGSISKQELEQWIMKYPVLEEICKGETVFSIKEADKSTMPAGSALDFHYDSGCEYWTKVIDLAGITIHKNYTCNKDPKSCFEDVEIVIYG